MVGRKRTEEKRKLVSQRYLNAVYNTDKSKEKKIEISIAIFPSHRANNLFERF